MGLSRNSLGKSSSGLASSGPLGLEGSRFCVAGLGFSGFRVSGLQGLGVRSPRPGFLRFLRFG